MIDIGANLANEQFSKDLEEVLINARNSGVSTIILTTTKYSVYLQNIKIIKKFSNILNLKTTYGLHPHYANLDKKIIFNNLGNILNNHKESHIVALGEFGLDYFRMISDKSTQQEVMNLFLEKAKDYSNLPLFMHERDSFKDFVSILKEHNVSNKKVVHCFTGNKEQVKQYLDLDCYIGITGWISDNKRNAELVEAVSYIPLEKIMIETDSPYLTPNMKNKPRRNEPKFLNYVLESLSHIKNIHPKNMQAILNNNSIDFFNLTAH